MGEEVLLAHTISHIRKFVLVIISLFVIYHSALHIESKRDTCQWLLQDGKFVANYKWQPFGCLLYNYNTTDSRLCLRRTANSLQSKTHLVFMGDTRVLQLYHHIIELISSPSSNIPTSSASHQYNYTVLDTNLEPNPVYKDPELGLLIEFKWRPNPTNEMFSDFYELLHPHSIHKKRLDPLDEIGSSREPKPSGPHSTNTILIVGHSLWPASGGATTSDSMIDAYKTNMTRLLTYVESLKRLERGTTVLWSLQDPVNEKKLSKRINITNAQIDEINYITEDLIHTVSIRELTLLTSPRAIAKNSVKFMADDGIHSSKLILDHKAQIILNYMCNRVYRYDGTCCSPTQNVTFIQLVFISGALLLISTYLFILVRPYFYRDNKSARIHTVKWQKVPQSDNTLLSQVDPHESDDDETEGNQDNVLVEREEDHVTLINNGAQASRATTTNVDGFPMLSLGRKDLLLANLAKLSLAIVFMFICDRTNFFMKENKYFTLANFILPIIYMFALGIFFTESQQSKVSDSIEGTMLSRNQTDEWKGWMQLVVLIYNLSSAEDNLRIYMLIRVLLSSYLFLTGFGHFTYFYRTRDTSLRRFCEVVLRLNLSVLCLCLCMNRPYQYYYFVPLCTFWFIIVYLTMKIKPIKNLGRPSANDHFWIIFKLAILSGLITMLYLSEVFFEKIFLLSPWRFLFTTGQDDSTIKNWWHHWSVDRYSVLAGMIYGLFHWTIVAPYFGIIDLNTTPRGSACHSRESSQGSQDELVLSNPFVAFQEMIRPRGTFINIMALTGISFYSLFAATCSDKASCDEIHAYVSFVPIICYLVLRNANEFMRKRHSILFAFIGRMSLELSLCQYHIWLAAGQKGLLVLVPSNTTLNLVITSIIFITTAHKLHFINKQLTQYATSFYDG